jgi:hypothetical protein
MPLLIAAAGVLVVLVGLGWLGLKIKPARFPPYPEQSQKLETVPLPAGLPAPVERFYRQAYGENMPVIQSAVISGRGTLRLFRLTLPIRFRFAHEAGRSFRSDIDLTVFGQPLMKAHKTLIDGHGRGKTPGGVDEGDWFDQSASIRMWAEIIDWFPAVLITDPRVLWKSIDEHTALLVVPIGNASDHLIVRLNPVNDKLQFIEAMKYKNVSTKMLWINGIWMDDGRPWLHLDIEDVIFNAEVQQYIHANEP